MISTLTSLIGARVGILLSGHFIEGTISAVNAQDGLTYLATADDGTWTITVANIDMLKVL